MTHMKRSSFVWLIAIVSMCAFDLGAGLYFPGFPGLVSNAEARVGRPLTPVSVAGTARRTSRRVARRTSYRVNTLPPGCPYGSYYGGNYYYCGGRYYEQSGNVYIQVVFD